ncbi:MAG: hypothetical protein U9Q07_04785 [Planctomycetota bacterium]|nr:hypothetical protein [Planctomycetota bacterium]
MAYALSKEPEGFSTKEDMELDEEERTVFMLGNLSRSQWDKFNNMISGKTGDMMALNGKAGTYVMEKALKGWSNFRYPNGDEVPWSSNIMTNLNALPAGTINQIVLELLNRNKLNEEDEKN